MELRERGDTTFVEVQRDGSRPALRRVSLKHAFNFGEPMVELYSELWKLWHQPLTVELPHLCKTLPPAFGRTGQLRKLIDQISPSVTGLPYFVAVDFRTVEQTAKTCQHLRDLSPDSFCARAMRFSNCRREIARGELAMSGREPADCILKSLAGTRRPDQEPNQAVAHDTQSCFLATDYNCLK